VLFNCNYRCIISSTSSSPAKISFESFELCFVSDSICGNSLSLNNPTDSRNEWKNKTLLSPSNKRQKQKTIDNKKKKYSDIIVGNEKSVEIAIIMFFVLKRKSFPRCFFFAVVAAASDVEEIETTTGEYWIERPVIVSFRCTTFDSVVRATMTYLAPQIVSMNI